MSMNHLLVFKFLTSLQSLSFSAADKNVLDWLNITWAGMLVLHGQDELRDAIEPTRELGTAELWSDENMYKHLSFLSNTYTNMVLLFGPCNARYH